MFCGRKKKLSTASQSVEHSRKASILARGLEVKDECLVAGGTVSASHVCQSDAIFEKALRQTTHKSERRW